jgi:hypothetical protein
MTDIQLELIQHHRVKARAHVRRFTESYGLLGGFGTLQNLSNIETEMTAPIWVPEEGKPDKGRWSESVTYLALLILRCPTPVDTRLIKTEVRVPEQPIRQQQRLTDSCADSD